MRSSEGESKSISQSFKMCWYIKVVHKGGVLYVNYLQEDHGIKEYGELETFIVWMKDSNEIGIGFILRGDPSSKIYERKDADKITDEIKIYVYV